jgi:antitoxin component YwqK of YwqJK toxin-antitoxin module
MKYFLIFLLFLLVACNEVTYSDQGFTDRKEAKNLMVDGVKEGKWVEYGFLFWIIRADTLDYTLTEYRHGLPVGIAREYFMNGKLKGEVHYDMEGKRNGMANGYYKNGILRAEFPFTNGQLNGSLIAYFSNGAIDSEATYINGVENGVVRHYHPNGKLESEITWKDGKEIASKDYPENDYH